jgi:decaprenylphospho-beta-D-erythro-pentofuranosid-2-ulose 2-reductase
MLTRKFKNIVLIGSNSDIGISIINHLPLAHNAKLYLIGKTPPNQNHINNLNIECKFKFCHLENLNEVKDIFKDSSDFIDLDLVIIAAGYLPLENSEFDVSSIEKTLIVNSLSSIILLSGFAKLMISNNRAQILIISSVASIRPRNRNFTYGASKKALDYFAIGLQNKLKNSSLSISILRPGFVYSKMTNNFKPAPFAITVDRLAEIVLIGLLRREKIIYAPRKLSLVMKIASILPRFIFDKLG